MRDGIDGADLMVAETAILLRHLCPWTSSEFYDRKAMLIFKATLFSYEGSPAGLLRRSVMN